MKKLTFVNIENELSRNEMKKIMAGSGEGCDLYCGDGDGIPFHCNPPCYIRDDVFTL